MTFHEFYLQDRERFLRAVTEVNWEAIALAADEEDSLLIAALIRGPLYDDIKDIEANSDLEPANQAVRDVIDQSRRQDAADHKRKS